MLWSWKALSGLAFLQGNPKTHPAGNLLCPGVISERWRGVECRGIRTTIVDLWITDFEHLECKCSTMLRIRFPCQVPQHRENCNSVAISMESNRTRKFCFKLADKSKESRLSQMQHKQGNFCISSMFVPVPVPLSLHVLYGSFCYLFPQVSTS